jgi:hypothetical protein
MLHDYDDIIRLSPERPKWWDANGVQRYCDFAPDQQANIYCDEAVLVLICCQACRCQFHVAFTGDRHTALFEAIKDTPKDAPDDQVTTRAETYMLAARIRDGSIHYGDPPSYFTDTARSRPGPHCCHAGATMNCLDLKVLQYWRKGDGWQWTRDKAMEVDLPDLKEWIEG